jgi:glycosyltransferase involved in cell wall biosynthesis
MRMKKSLSITSSWPHKNSLAWQMMHFNAERNIHLRKKSNASIRVLHLLSQQPGKTGSGVYLQALVDQGAKVNIKQRIIVGIPADLPKPIITPLESCEIKAVRFCDPDLPFPVAGMSDVMPYTSTRFSEFTCEMLDIYLQAFAEIIAREVKEFHPDIIHTHHLWLMTALTRVLNQNIPVVTTCHGTELRQLELAPELANFVIPPCSKIEKVMALHENHISRISDRYGIPPSRIALVGAGYRDDIFCPPSSHYCLRHEKETLTIVYAGKLSFAKGLPWLIEAFEKLYHPKGKNLKLTIAGSGKGDEARHIKEKALRSGDRIEFTGANPQEELASIFKNADILVLPSFYEGLPLVVFEAMACSCRVVVTRLPGINHWLPENLVQSGIVELVPLPRLIGPDVPDPSHLPRFTGNLITAINKQLHRCMENEPDWEGEVITSIESMNWEGIFNKVKKVYQEILS